MCGNTNPGFYKHRNLPHLDEAFAVQFVTIVLADAAPAGQQPRRPIVANSDGDMLFLKIDAHLDRGRGSCLLRKEQYASLVIDVVCGSSDLGYIPIAWVVMPNHVHLLLQQTESQLGHAIGRIKARCSTRINRMRGSSGKLWQGSYFDRKIRSIEHLWNTIEYIHDNPVAAGLVDMPEKWQFSSIHGFSFPESLGTIDRIYHGSK